MKPKSAQVSTLGQGSCVFGFLGFLGFRVEGFTVLGFGVWDLRSRVPGLGFKWITPLNIPYSSPLHNLLDNRPFIRSLDYGSLVFAFERFGL